MSVIIDLVLVAVFIFCAVFYYKKGLLSSIIGFARFWVALGLAFLFSGGLAERLQPAIESNLGTDEGGSFVSQLVGMAVSSGFVARVLAFAIIFIVSFIAVKILELVLNIFVKLPVLNFMNNILGLAIGVVIGFFWIQLLSVLLMTFAEYLASSVSWLSVEDFDNTLLAKFLYENNLFRIIFESLTD